MGIGGHQLLDLDGGGLAVQGADEGVAVAILGGGDGGFGLEDRVDAADSVGDFGGDLEEEVVADVSFDGVVHVDRYEV